MQKLRWREHGLCLCWGVYEAGWSFAMCVKKREKLGLIFARQWASPGADDLKEKQAMGLFILT